MMPETATSDSFGMVQLLMMLSGVAIMILLLRRHQFRSATKRDVTREQLARLRDQSRLRNSMDDLLIHLEEVARQVTAQVDTHFTKLELVIRDADERIAKLEALGAGSNGAPDHADDPTASPEGREDSSPRRLDSRAAGETDTASAPQPRSQPRTPGNGASTHARPRPAFERRIDPRHQQVYDLADAGHKPIKVAEELGMPLGEIELILNLRKLQ